MDTETSTFIFVVAAIVMVVIIALRSKKDYELYSRDKRAYFRRAGLAALLSVGLICLGSLVELGVLSGL